MATVIDHLILFATFLWILRVSGFPRDIDSVRSRRDPCRRCISLARRVLALLEGVWGASIGKACAGIRVAGPDGRPAGLVRVMCRSVLFVLAFDAVSLIVLVIAPGGTAETRRLGLDST